jgi:hypothetical protein
MYFVAKGEREYIAGSGKLFVTYEPGRPQQAMITFICNFTGSSHGVGRKRHIGDIASMDVGTRRSSFTVHQHDV